MTGGLSGLTANALLYASDGTTLEQSSGLKWGPTAGLGLQIAAGTATTDVNALSLTQTWNAAGVAFTGLKFTITDTASAAGALAMQILGGAAGTTNLLSLGKTGSLTAGAELIVGTASSSDGFLLKGRTSFRYVAELLNGDGTARSDLYVSSLRAIATSASYLPVAYIGDVGSSVGRFTLTGNTGSTFGWSGVSNDATQAIDTAFTRLSAGLIGVGTGAAGSFAGSLKLTNTQNVGYIQADEMTAPAGAANSARLFTQDNGAGKTQLMVIFGSGVAQQIAIEA
jgi:hypothetical protein